MNRLKHFMHGTQTAADLLPEQSIVKKPEYSANVISFRRDDCKNCGQKIPAERKSNFCTDWCYDDRVYDLGFSKSDQD